MPSPQRVHQRAEHCDASRSGSQRCRPPRLSLPSFVILRCKAVLRLPATVGCAVLLALCGCGQVDASRLSDAPSSAPAQPEPAASPTSPPTAPATVTPASAAPQPQTQAPPPAPPPPTISVAFASGSVTVSVTGIAGGGHQVHVHRDCSGNPNLHITTLGDVFVNPDGSGSRTFSLAPSLRGRGFDLLVYPLGASQGPPTLCTGI